VRTLLAAAVIVCGSAAADQLSLEGRQACRHFRRAILAPAVLYARQHSQYHCETRPGKSVDELLKELVQQ
jgi:hypothetical protein